MDTFNFVDLYGFLQTALGMVLAFLGGRRSMKRNEKSRPISDKKRGSNTETHQAVRFAGSGCSPPQVTVRAVACFYYIRFDKKINKKISIIFT